MARTTVGARLLGPLVDYLRTHHVDADALASSVGLDPVAMADPDARVEAARSVRLWKAAESALEDPLIGLHVGATVTRESFDLLSQATAVSGTFREMGERLTRFIAMAAPGPVYELRESGDRAWWIVGDVFPNARCIRHLCELTVSLGVSYMKQLSSSGIAPKRVHFDHPAAADVRDYERLFGCPVSFAQHEAGFEIARSWLDRPLPRADPGLARVLDRYADEAVRKVPHQTDLGQAVQAALGTLLMQGKDADLRVLSKRLALSSRSLQRQLQAEGHSFQELLDQQRHTLALRLLEQDRTSITDVAEQLGFSDVAAFRRAFKRWTGLAPRAYLARESRRG